MLQTLEQKALQSALNLGSYGLAKFPIYVFPVEYNPL